MPRERRYTKDSPEQEYTITADEEYLSKTQSIVNFLMHIFSENIVMVAAIQVAQAERNSERLIDMLGLIKGRVEDWIQELKNIQD